MTAQPTIAPKPDGGSSGVPLLSVRDLTVTFGKGRQEFKAVDGVSFDVAAGQTVGLVGESGCGKSVTSLALMGLLPARGNTVGGSAKFDGAELLTMSGDQLRNRRGRDLAMIFQDPLSSLNPVVPIGIQVAEVVQRHKGLKRAAAMEQARVMLDKVGIPDATRRLKEYPHQLSGGMRQRALIAMALACEPRLLIADEPTTALDVTIQAQILTLLKELVEETGTALIMITHDLGVIAGLVDEVNVLYAGRIVERAERHDLFARPRHPYTGGLLASIPRLHEERGRRLTPVPGSVADNIPWTSACAFAPRCSSEIPICREVTPPLVPDTDLSDEGRLLACHNPLTSNPLDHPTDHRATSSYTDNAVDDPTAGSATVTEDSPTGQEETR